MALSGADFVAAVAGRRKPVTAPVSGGLRFAFYGRMSTSDCQDPVTSRAWQRAASDDLVDGFGRVVVEFFDEGRSRRWSWWNRPAASALLAAAAAPGRAFDAVVVGEYERAFEGDQFRAVVRHLNSLGVQVWLPEASGPVDLDSPVHEALMILLGARARHEVARARRRTLGAMRQQTRQGRFLGGRPPYGYRLVAGGPHPNARHTAWGRRATVLAPHPETAPWVRWIFAERAQGRSVASIARELNDRGVPCPSATDPRRNQHRSGDRWITRTVSMILENPRYTGRQVWNRQNTRGRGGDGRAGGRGAGAARWTAAGEWEVSDRLAHMPLVDETTFIAVQRIRADRPTHDGLSRQYALAGLLTCGICGRRMDAHWVHGRPGYRCRHGHTTAATRPPDTPPNLYLREDHLLAELPALLNTTPAQPEHHPTELVHRLRQRGLQIICDRHQRHLTPATRANSPDLPDRDLQTTLALTWTIDPRPTPHTHDHDHDATPTQTTPIPVVSEPDSPI